jgi:hypothetical protein
MQLEVVLGAFVDAKHSPKVAFILRTNSDV